jgi:hypothetical protein
VRQHAAEIFHAEMTLLRHDVTSWRKTIPEILSERQSLESKKGILQDLLAFLYPSFMGDV